MQVVAGQVGHHGAQRGDLREREVDEDHASLDDVDAEVGVDSRQDEARDEGGEEDLEDAHFLSFIALTNASMS